MLFLGLAQLAGEPGDLGFLAGWGKNCAGAQPLGLSPCGFALWPVCCLLWSAVASPTQGLGLRRYQGGITAGICGRRNGVQYKFAERSLSAFGPGCSPIPGARWLYRRWMLRCLYNPARVNSVFGRREAAVAYHFWQERSAEVRRTAPRACCVCRRQQEPLLQRAYAVAVIYRY